MLRSQFNWSDIKCFFPFFIPSLEDDAPSHSFVTGLNEAIILSAFMAIPLMTFSFFIPSKKTVAFKTYVCNTSKDYICKI